MSEEFILAAEELLAATLKSRRPMSLGGVKVSLKVDLQAEIYITL